MDVIEQVNIFGHTFEPNISQIGLFSLIFNCAKPQLFDDKLIDELPWNAIY